MISCTSRLTYRRQRFGGRLAEQLPEAVLQPVHRSRRGFLACGRRYRDDAASYASNRVENGARGPENELSAGAGTNAHDGRGFRRPARSCTLDILAPEAMFTDPLSPVLIELSAVFDFVPSVSNSRSYYAQGVFFGLPEDPFAILVVLDEPHWGCAPRVWLWLCVHARSCGGCSWAAAAGLCMTAGALRRRHGDRLRLGAEVGGRLLFIPSAPRLSNPPMSLLRCT